MPEADQAVTCTAACSWWLIKAAYDCDASVIWHGFPVKHMKHLRGVEPALAAASLGSVEDEVIHHVHGKQGQSFQTVS